MLFRSLHHTRHQREVAGVVLCCSLAIHRLEQPGLRLALYAALMAAVLAAWFTWLGGARRVRAFESV